MGGQRLLRIAREARAPLEATILAAMLCVTAIALPANAAELRIFTPTVERGELGIENNSAVSFDKSAKRNDQQSHFASGTYGLTDFWRTELEGHWENGDGDVRLRTLNNMNVFQVLKSAVHSVDLGLLEEFDYGIDGRTPHTLTLGTLLQKEISASRTVVNVFFDREFGRQATTGTIFRYSGRSIWQVVPLIGPGVEFYGQPGRIGRLPDFSKQDQRFGPSLAGGIDIEGLGELAYGVAYVFGLTPATPKETIVWRFELGIRF